MFESGLSQLFDGEGDLRVELFVDVTLDFSLIWERYELLAQVDYSSQTEILHGVDNSLQLLLAQNLETTFRCDLGTQR